MNGYLTDALREKELSRSERERAAGKCRRLFNAVNDLVQIGRTFWASSPFRPFAISNSTR